VFEVKILLVHCKSSIGNELSHPKLEHLGLGYLASVLRQHGYEVMILDAHLLGFSAKETVEKILQEEYGLIGFTIFSTNLECTMQVISLLRSHGARTHIALGGYFPTFLYKELFTHYSGFDSIVRGEAEYAFLELAKKIENSQDWRRIQNIAYLEDGKIITNPMRPLIHDLDELPFPSRDTLPDLIKAGNPVISVSPSRGCYMNCSFCSIISFYGLSDGAKWRERSPENIVDEIELLLNSEIAKEHSIDYIWFAVDEFIGHKKNGKTHAQRIAEEILKRRLNFRFEIACRADRVEEELFEPLFEAGLRSVYMGVESFVQNQLDSFNKNCTVGDNERAIDILEDLGIDYTLGTIVFSPETTFEEFKANQEAIRQIGYRHVTVPLARLKLFKGTSLEREMRQSEGSRGFSRQSYLSNRQLRYDLESLTESQFDKIYDYEFSDLQAAKLWEILSTCRESNEELVAAIIELHTNQLIDGVTFWKLVFLVRDALALYVDEAIGAVQDDIDSQQVIEKHFERFQRSKKELRQFRTFLESAEPETEIFYFTLNEQKILYDNRTAQLPVIPGLEKEIAEKEYRKRGDILTIG